MTARILEFLSAIGIHAARADLGEETFLPGLTIRNGVLLIDESRLLSPGDILHEAGHLAVMLPEQRARAAAPLDADAGWEMAAIAWSYAAAVHLEVPLRMLFHEAGYKGGSDSLIESFSNGRYVGVPLLEWAGLTATGERAACEGIGPYPVMRRWLRE